MSEPQTTSSQYPVDNAVNVIEGTDIYKTNKWWCAVLKVNMFGHNKVMVYMWQYKEDRKKDPQSGKWVGTGSYRWRVQQKMGINFVKNWEDIKVAVDKYLSELGIT